MDLFSSDIFSVFYFISQVDGLCKLLKQNVKTLKSIEFIHCKLSTSFVNCICESLSVEGVSTHGIHHFSIKTSSFLERDSFPLPVGLASFLATGRYGPFLAQFFFLFWLGLVEQVQLIFPLSSSILLRVLNSLTYLLGLLLRFTCTLSIWNSICFCCLLYYTRIS